MEGYTRHAIQIGYIAVQELKAISAEEDRVETDSAAQADDSANGDEGDFTLTVGHTEYDRDTKTVGVSVAASVFAKMSGQPKHPGYNFRVEVRATFNVDDTRFPANYVEDWAERNAPLVIYPYVREHLSSLCYRCGVTDIGLPLFEVPTFRVEADSKDEKKDG